MALSIVIPVYKEKHNLKELIVRIKRSFKEKNYEVIIIDDDSNDGTREQLKSLKKKYQKLKFFIRKQKPRDLSKSCVFGFSKAKFKNILVMDGDLQHKPEEINKLYKSFLKLKCDFVVGSRDLFRMKNKSLSFIRLYTSITLIFIVNLFLGFRTRDPMSGFFIFKREIFLQNKQKLFMNGYKILLDLIYSCKNPMVQDININFKSREKGFSKMDIKVIFLLGLIILQKFFRKFF